MVAMAQLVEMSKGLWSTSIPLFSACPCALCMQNMKVVAETVFGVMNRVCFSEVVFEE